MSNLSNSYSTKAAKVSTILGAIFLLTVSAVCAYVWLMDGGEGLLCSPRTDVNFLKRLTDCGGLSNLGDFLAGVFAPLAFLGLAIAYFTQREQLQLAIRDSNDNRQARLKEAALNYASVQTNYKMGLYDKRKFVFDQLLDAGDMFDRDVSQAIVLKLKLALHDAQFLFPDEMHEWILMTLRNAERIKFQQAQVDGLERKQSIAGLSDEENSVLIAAYQDISESKMAIHKSLLSQSLFERFRSYLRLPNQINPE